MFMLNEMLMHIQVNRCLNLWIEISLHSCCPYICVFFHSRQLLVIIFSFCFQECTGKKRMNRTDRLF